MRHAHRLKHQFVPLSLLLVILPACNLIMDLIPRETKPYLDVNPGASSLIIGESEQLTVYYCEDDNTCLDVTSEVSWASETREILDISQTGIATALALGRAEITVTYKTLSRLKIIQVIKAPPVPWFTFLGGPETDTGGDVALTNDGGFIVSGFSDFSFPYPDLTPINAFTESGTNLILAKYNAEGDCQWYTFFGTVYPDPAYGKVIQTADNGYVFAGAYNTDILLVKFDESGIQTWYSTLGGAGNDYACGVTEKSDGKLVVAGVSDNALSLPAPQGGFTYNGANDILVVEFNADGSRVGCWLDFIGSSAEEFARDITSDENDDLYIVGHGQSDFGSPSPQRIYTGGDDIIVLKLNSDGTTMLWNSFLGNTTTDYGRSILMHNGGLYAAGNSNGAFGSPLQGISGTSTYDLILSKLDPATGDLLWHTYFGSPGSEELGYITSTSDGNIILAGEGLEDITGTSYPYVPTYKNILVAAFEPGGSELWHTFIGDSGGDSNLAGITGSPEGGVIISGFTTSESGSPLHPHAGTGKTDLLLIHLGQEGESPR